MIKHPTIEGRVAIYMFYQSTIAVEFTRFCVFMLINFYSFVSNKDCEDMEIQ